MNQPTSYYDDNDTDTDTDTGDDDDDSISTSRQSSSRSTPSDWNNSWTFSVVLCIRSGVIAISSLTSLIPSSFSLVLPFSLSIVGDERAAATAAVAVGAIDDSEEDDADGEEEMLVMLVRTAIVMGETCGEEDSYCTSSIQR